MKRPASFWPIQRASCMDWNRISRGFSPGFHRLWRAGRRKSFDLSKLTIPKFTLLVPFSHLGASSPVLQSL